MTKSERNMLLVGIGSGIVVGVGTGYLIGSNSRKKRHNEEVRRARRRGYDAGLNDGIEESKKWIDENMIIVEDPSDTENVRKAIEAKMNAGNQDEDAAVETTETAKATGTPVREEPPEMMIGMAEYDANNHQVVFNAAAGSKISYPANLFLDDNFDILPAGTIRENIRKHEHNKARLNLIWNQMGWGAYVPDLDGPVGKEVSNSIGEDIKESDDDDDSGPSEEEINNWDLSLDGEDTDIDAVYGDEPEEKTLERSRYLDEIDRYKAHPEDAPRIISRREFEEECYLDKVYIDYYDVDNVFGESDDLDKEIGAFDYFGVSDGKELFSKGRDFSEEDGDPDIVHIKNFKMHCVIEVTRLHKSYQSIKDGSAYLTE